MVWYQCCRGGNNVVNQEASLCIRSFFRKGRDMTAADVGGGAIPLLAEGQFRCWHFILFSSPKSINLNGAPRWRARVKAPNDL